MAERVAELSAFSVVNEVVTSVVVGGRLLVIVVCLITVTVESLGMVCVTPESTTCDVVLDGDCGVDETAEEACKGVGDGVGFVPASSTVEEETANRVGSMLFVELEEEDCSESCLLSFGTVGSQQSCWTCTLPRCLFHKLELFIVKLLKASFKTNKVTWRGRLFCLWDGMYNNVSGM